MTTPNFGWDLPVVGADADVWGGKLNDIFDDQDTALASPANTLKGNNTGATVPPLNLTGAQVAVMLPAVVGDSGSGGTKGLVPVPAAGDAAARKVLTAGGVWGYEIAAQGVFTGSTGATLKARGVSVSRSATGTYTVTLSPAMADANYVVIPTFQDLNAVLYSVQSQLAGSFVLATIIAGGSAVDPAKIFLTVLA